MDTLACRECTAEFSCTPKWRKQHGHWCHKCYAKYQKRYRDAHPENYKLHQAPWKATNRSRVNASNAEFRRSKLGKYLELKAAPCAACGQSYPHYVMQFDHVKPGKRACVSEMLLGNYEKLLAEVAKCELVCANCHAERTYKRAQEKRENVGSRISVTRRTTAGSERSSQI